MSIDEIPDFPLTVIAPLAKRFRALGISSFADASHYVRKLPYGRPHAIAEIDAVLVEGKGTCSSKHVVLAKLAREQGRFEIELVLGIFEMYEANTPGVGEVLSKHGLISVPEAHCYLRCRGSRFDLTGLPSGKESLFDSLLSEECVDPDAALHSKKRQHRAILDMWAVKYGFEPEFIWKVREECIEAFEKRGRSASQ